MHLHCMLLTWRCSRRALWTVARYQSPFPGTTYPSPHYTSRDVVKQLPVEPVIQKEIPLYRIQSNYLLQHVAIKNPLAIPRAALAPPKIAPGVQMVKEVKKEVIQDLQLVWSDTMSSAQ